MNYSLEDVKNSIPEEKKKIDKMDIWVYYFVRPVSFYVTWVCMKFKLSANNASFFSIIISLTGFFFLSKGTFVSILIGLIIMNFWIIFDCVDGNIARVTKSSSTYGTFLDALSGYIYMTLLYFGLGIAVFKYNHVFLEVDNKWLFIVIGSLASISCLLPRLVDHKVTTLFKDNNSNVSDKNSYGVFKLIALNIAGAAGLMNPLMIIFFLLNLLDLYLLIYTSIHLLICVYSILKSIKRARSFNE